MNNTSILDKVKLHLYYFIIGIISFVALVFLPMVGTEIGLAWNIPNTTIGWIIWITLKCVIAIINVLIFHSFMQQAKINVKDNDKYKSALEILNQLKYNKKYIPRSPHKWNTQQYSTKAVSIFISTLLATIAFTQAILTFDYMTMLTYLFTIIMGIIFGIIQMKTAEEYWTDEFYKYAIMIKEQNISEKEIKESMVLAATEHTKQRHDTIHDNSGVNLLESGDCNHDISNNSKQVVVDNKCSDCSVLVRTVYPSSTSTNNISNNTTNSNK